MKKFIYKSLLFSILFIAIIMLVNYNGDAANLFKEGFEKKIVSIITKKKNATNLSNFDRRILAREIVDASTKSPEILILGSSRIMLINSSYFFNQTLINNGVTGASIQDIIAIYQMYKTKKILPRKIILGVDPWIFNINNEQSEWLTLSKEYYSYYNKENIETKNIHKIKQLLSLAYFQSSYKNLFSNSLPLSVNKRYNDTNTILYDGSLTYGKEYRENTQEVVNNKAKTFLQNGIYSLEKFDSISSDLSSEFQNFCNEILNNDIELNFFLTPYHPIVFKKIENEYKIVLEIENMIEEFAKKSNIKYAGSFSPKKSNLNETHFYDGMHLNEEGVKIILKELSKP